eukprot:14073617-Heterocapsa_arctica.AAC.1
MMTEDYPPQMKGYKGPGAQQKGKHNEEDTAQNMGTEKKKLEQMKAAAKAFENLEGFEERLEELRGEIKEQQKLSNQEGL